jgi:hypothetical protein
LNSVQAIAAFDHGSGPTLYAGGKFTTVGGVMASNIAKWDGSSWAPLGSGTNDIVRDLEVFDDGSGPALYVAGAFTTAGGIPANGIAKWDGSSWSALASEPASQPTHLTLFDDGSGLALYGVTTSGGVQTLSRWDGSIWMPLANGFTGYVGNVWDMEAFDDGERSMLYVGGDFQVSWTGDTYLARWGCPLANVQRKTRAR